MSTGSIVCGIDNSPLARGAARAAAALAERLRLRLVLVHAVTAAARPTGAPPLAELAAEVEAERGAGERLLADVGRELGVDVRTLVRPGAAAPCLAAVAREERAALVVVGSRGTGALRATFAGAVTDELVAQAPCPVMVVPPGVAEGPRTGLSGDHIVCGVQHGEDLACARHARWLAEELGLRVKLAHVVPRTPDVVGIAPAGVLSRNMPMPVQALERDAEQRLRDLAQQLPGRTDVDLWVTRGDAAGELIELGAGEGAALVVVGTRRWRGSGRAAVLGSVARRLACEGSSPVVVCPSNPSAGGAADAA